ncbi:hypothetical protein AX15_005620 [Amanita polypyramis BW_CC]|nr:hypothetical protein AX15_005620 [Amanita polypyramis BW_CC]
MRLLPLALLAGLSPVRVLAWGAAGHEIVATIAQIHLHPSAYPTICSILNYTSPNPDEPPCHLAVVATWADRIRFRMHWSGPLHYVNAIDDHPPETCLFPGEQGWQGREDANVLSATRNVTNLLADYTARTRQGITVTAKDTEVANEALKFLIHFMGDMHQPLHLAGRDRGGNGDKVVFDGRQTNLHSVWDTLLIAKAIRATPHKYNHPSSDGRIEYSLRGAIYDPYVRWIMKEGVLDEWADEITQWLDCPAREVPSEEDSMGWQRVLSWLKGTDISDPGARTDDENLCPYAWTKPIHALNCEIVWPKELDEESYRQWLSMQHDDDHESLQSIEQELALVSNEGRFIGGRRPKHEGPELDTPEYAAVIVKRKLVERLLAQGGVRLANTLNFLFADDA